jgi:transposase
MVGKRTLSESQRAELLQTLRSETSGLVRERILIVLLRDDGKTYAEIGKFLGCTLKTAARWCNQVNLNDLNSFRDGRAKGNHVKATPEYIKQLLETVEREPSEYGYEFGRWTTSRLATHMSETTDIYLGGEQIRRILRQKKYVYIWAKADLSEKQDQPKREAYKQKLSHYFALTQDKPEIIQIWFWDESGFSLRVIRRKTWGKKGKRRKVSGQRRTGRVNVMGGLRYHDRHRLCFFIERGNSETFYGQLEQLQAFVQQEWVAQGHDAAEFEIKGPKIIVLVDNASYHKRLETLAQIAANLTNIVVDFLPEYSPDLNLIELVWHSCKEYIAHRTFSSKQQLEELLHRLLNQGELQIKWNRKRKNKGNAID